MDTDAFALRQAADVLERRAREQGKETMVVSILVRTLRLTAERWEAKVSV